MVALYWFEKRLLTYWFIRDVLPTLTRLAVLYCRMIKSISCHEYGGWGAVDMISPTITSYIYTSPPTTYPPVYSCIMRSSFMRPRARDPLCSYLTTE